MKAIMMSIRPQHVVNILNGKKTIEIRKSIPKCDLPIDVYIYVTSHKNYTQSLYECVSPNKRRKFGVDKYRPSDPDFILNGKVVAKFTLNKVEEIPQVWKWEKGYERYLENKGCVSQKELFTYLNVHSPKRCGYACHIDNVVPFDKPKEISEFNIYCKSGAKCLHCKHYWTDDSAGYSIPMCSKCLTKAPQSWCYVEV